MASSQLKVDYEQLAALHRRLDTASDNMRDDSDTMSALASAVGEERLADRIREFGKDWSVHRAGIRENIDWLKGKVELISDELEKIDGDLARGLSDAGTAPATPRGRGPRAV